MRLLACGCLGSRNRRLTRGEIFGRRWKLINCKGLTKDWPSHFLYKQIWPQICLKDFLSIWSFGLWNLLKTNFAQWYRFSIAFHSIPKNKVPRLQSSAAVEFLWTHHGFKVVAEMGEMKWTWLQPKTWQVCITYYNVITKGLPMGLPIQLLFMK